MADESCAHRQVSYDPISRDGGYTDRWLCASGCGMEFVHAPYYKRGESIKIDAGDSGVITAVETWYCVQRGTVSQWFTAQDLSCVPPTPYDGPHDAQEAQEAQGGPSVEKPDPDATEGKTEASGAKSDAETVRLVRRLRGIAAAWWPRGRESAIVKADAWLAAQAKPAERWEPCSGEHVETLAGLWLRLLPDSDETYTRCPGEHRRWHEGCCDYTVLRDCDGVGWERKV